MADGALPPTAYGATCGSEIVSSDHGANDRSGRNPALRTWNRGALRIPKLGLPPGIGLECGGGKPPGHGIDLSLLLCEAAADCHRDPVFLDGSLGVTVCCCVTLAVGDCQ